MPRHRSPRPIARQGQCRSTTRRRRNKAWLRTLVEARIAAVARFIELKRRESVEGATAFAGRGGPAAREEPCDADANAPSIPR
ncbi:MAG: hypothetical protein KKC14_11870 [Alphaproteobacteria bacterium]|nr:hypothetical protein [Alphaproteobacteria bacterium]